MTRVPRGFAVVRAGRVASSVSESSTGLVASLVSECEQRAQAGKQLQAAPLTARMHLHRRLPHDMHGRTLHSQHPPSIALPCRGSAS